MGRVSKSGLLEIGSAVSASKYRSSFPSHKPNLLLVDHVPAGTYGGLLSTLRIPKELRSHKCESQ